MVTNLQNNLISKEALYGAKNYSPLPIVLNKGEGVYLWDIDGNKYLDMMSAYSAVSHGHSHPELVKVLSDQAQKLAISSRAFYTEPFAEYIEKLSKISNFESVLPMNTGAEAVETAIKAARRWGYFTKGIKKNCAEIIVAEGNFHGRTTTIVGFSSEKEYKKGFGPFAEGFIEAKYCSSNCNCSKVCENSIRSIKNAINKNTCAVIVEPIQGEGGIITPQSGWLKQLRELCNESNVLLILDEIQSGLGRTGKLFAFEHYDIIPDMLVYGKGLGGGFPIGAHSTSKEKMKLFKEKPILGHITTFGGHPVISSAALANLKETLNSGIIDSVNQKEKLFRKYLKHELIEEVRGKGLMLAIILKGNNSSYKLVSKSLEKGLILFYLLFEPKAVRITPPLTISNIDIKKGCEIILEILDELKKSVN